MIPRGEYERILASIRCDLHVIEAALIRSKRELLKLEKDLRGN